MEIQDGQVVLGGIPASELAGKYGTPLFVLEKNGIQNNYRLLMENIAYRPFVIHYACKANWNIQIMRLLRSEGAHLDACSPGDVYLGLKAGFDPSEVFYTGYAVSNDEMSNLIKLGVHVNVDSISQIHRYVECGGTGKIGLRINPGILVNSHPHIASSGINGKFGIHPSQFDEVLSVAKSMGLIINGLHTHLGSDILEHEPFLDLLSVFIGSTKIFSDIEYFDLGGGLGVPFEPIQQPFNLAKFGELLTEKLMSWSIQTGKKITLRIEPGEFLVSEAGYLLFRVIDVKKSIDIGEIITPVFIGTDTSFNHVFSTAIYDSYHKIIIADRAEDLGVQAVHVCGNLMQAGDILAKNRLLPLIKEGDLLVMKNCGTYAMCRAARFNARPLPAEVMVSDGKSRLIRNRESLEDLLNNQMLD